MSHIFDSSVYLSTPPPWCEYMGMTITHLFRLNIRWRYGRLSIDVACGPLWTVDMSQFSYAWPLDGSCRYARSIKPAAVAAQGACLGPIVFHSWSVCFSINSVIVHTCMQSMHEWSLYVADWSFKRLHWAALRWLFCFGKWLAVLHICKWSKLMVNYIKMYKRRKRVVATPLPNLLYVDAYLTVTDACSLWLPRVGKHVTLYSVRMFALDLVVFPSACPPPIDFCWSIRVCVCLDPLRIICRFVSVVMSAHISNASYIRVWTCTFRDADFELWVWPI